MTQRTRWVGEWKLDGTVKGEVKEDFEVLTLLPSGKAVIERKFFSQKGFVFFLEISFTFTFVEFLYPPATHFQSFVSCTFSLLHSLTPFEKEIIR